MNSLSNWWLKIALLSLLILANILLDACGGPHLPTVGLAQFGILYDPSKSSASKCDCVNTLAERVLAAPGLSAASKLTLFKLGNAATANEPVLIAQYPLQRKRAVADGQDQERRRRENLLNDLKDQCGNVSASDRSPIFFGIKRAVEHLRSLGCGEDSMCHLYVATDGEELSELGIKQALNGHLSKDGSAFPNPIANKGIQITFCGLAETSGTHTSPDGREKRLTLDRDPQRADRLKEVWTRLFTATEQVHFEPFCSTRPGLAATPRP